jgi:hypothetical protein
VTKGATNRFYESPDMKQFLFALTFTLATFLVGSPSWGQLACYRAHAGRSIDPIASAGLSEFVSLKNGQYVGIYLVGNDLHSKYFSTLDEVKAFYKNLPGLDRTFFSSLIASQKASMYESISMLTSAASREGAHLSWRLKEMESLKDKILKRIQDLEKIGAAYTLDMLHDALGIRMTVPFSSDLLRIKTKEAWAQALNLPIELIVEVEEKGNNKDIMKGRYYTATHIAIRGSNGHTFELQVMSRAMEIWSDWDHPNVMKPKVIAFNQDRLKIYSVDWAQIIHDLTPFSSRQERASALLATAAKFGLRHTYTSAKAFIVDLNNAIKRELGLSVDQGFSPAQLDELARTLP